MKVRLREHSEAKENLVTTMARLQIAKKSDGETVL